MAEEKEKDTSKENTEKEEKEESKEEEAKKEEKSESKAEETKEEKEVEVPEKFKKLVEEIENMKVADLAELVKILEKKFGVSAAPVAVAAAPATGGAGGEGGGEEKSEYNIILKSIGDKKIEVIKVVRDVTGKGLKEAKDLVDAAANEPQTVKEKVKKEEAEEIKKKFEAAGATVELQ